MCLWRKVNQGIGGQGSGEKAILQIGQGKAHRASHIWGKKLCSRMRKHPEKMSWVGAFLAHWRNWPEVSVIGTGQVRSKGMRLDLDRIWMSLSGLWFLLKWSEMRNHSVLGGKMPYLTSVIKRRVMLEAEAGASVGRLWKQNIYEEGDVGVDQMWWRCGGIGHTLWRQSGWNVVTGSMWGWEPGGSMAFPWTRVEGEQMKGFGEKDLGCTEFSMSIRLPMICWFCMN